MWFWGITSGATPCMRKIDSFILSLKRLPSLSTRPSDPQNDYLQIAIFNIKNINHILSNLNSSFDKFPPKIDLFTKIRDFLPSFRLGLRYYCDFYVDFLIYRQYLMMLFSLFQQSYPTLSPRFAPCTSTSIFLYGLVSFLRP